MRAAAVAAILTSALAAPAIAETRCGWVDNPTPGNWWLTDRDGTWTISTQGVPSVNGWDTIAPFDLPGWVETNGHYGFGCGCFEGSVDWSTGEVAWMSSMRGIPMSRCHNDPALPPR